MAKRTPTDTDAPAPARNICGHLDRKGDVQRVCVRDPHDDAQHNMFPATAELARSLAARGVRGGPGLDQFGSPHDGEYHEAPGPIHPEETGLRWPDRDGDNAPTLVTGNADVLAALPPPEDGQAADPPAIPRESGDALEPSSAAGSGGGSGRPQELTGSASPTTPHADVVRGPGQAAQAPAISGDGGSSRSASPGRSIGRVLANTVIDAAHGVPADVQDERAHAREAVEILVEAAADHHRHNRLMPADKLLDLEAVVQHMVQSRGLR